MYNLQEKMLELKEQLLAKGSESRSQAEICEEVLGRSSGYVKWLGFGPLPQTHASFKRTTTELQQRLKPKNEEIESQSTQLQSQSEKILRVKKLNDCNNKICKSQRF